VSLLWRRCGPIKGDKVIAEHKLLRLQPN